MAIKSNQTKINNQAPAFNGGFNKVVKSENAIKSINWIGERSTPTNRFVLGVTALLMQAPIDYYNKRVDEETRKVSCARTIAKTVVGTITGIAVRAGCISTIKHWSVADAKELNWKNVLIPRHITIEKFKDATRIMKKHGEALGTFFALGVMLITNFAIDVPLSKMLTNVLIKKIPTPDGKKVAEKGGK